MADDRRVRISKLLALALRHRPDALGLTLDEAGWAAVSDVLDGLARQGIALDRDGLRELVQADEKRRLALDGERIRANQGHSIRVDLGLERRSPPEILLHGTLERFLPSIRESGLLPAERTHVHLSPDEHTAEIVARRRRGPIVVLRVRARAMHDAGYAFFLSDNGVWLTLRVPPEFLELP